MHTTQGNVRTSCTTTVRRCMHATEAHQLAAFSCHHQAVTTPATDTQLPTPAAETQQPTLAAGAWVTTQPLAPSHPCQ